MKSHAVDHWFAPASLEEGSPAAGGARVPALVRRSNDQPPPALADTTGSLQNGRRFQPGVSGNPAGRPKGSKNKISELFLQTLAMDFATHGAQAIERVRRIDPVKYVKIIALLVPRELVLNREQGPDFDVDELSDDEIVALIEARRRRKILEAALKDD